ncbi:MAG: GDP-mannose 4,6-dehydratase [Solirubrobacteraceae bacterium]
MRVLITGASGFVGGHLSLACAREGDEVIGLSRTGRVPEGAGEGRAIDLRDGAAARRAFADAAPEVVYHLAALSSVGRSWEDPARTVTDNVGCAISVLEAVRTAAPQARVVWVSSCEVYGAPAELPVHERAPLAPANPYAVSKASGDMLAGVYAAAHGLEIIRARPFNHAGPGQLPIFIVSSLAQQAAQARIAGDEVVRILTGNPDTRRDFTDVRDVARAYRLLAQGAAGIANGRTAAVIPDEGIGTGIPTERAAAGVYNVSSGRSVSAAEQVELLAELMAPIKVEHSVDPARARAHEVMDLRGSHDRLTAATGWAPEIPLRQTMADTIAWWERELARTAAC